MPSPHDIGNPGYGGGRVHPWDAVPPEPGRFDFIVENVPGVDPMAFNREIDYHTMQQGVRHMLLEQERQARMGSLSYPTSPVLYSPVTQVAVSPSKQVAIPSQPKPPPVLQHTYLVVDERKPRRGNYEASLWELFVVRQALVVLIFAGLTAIVAKWSFWVLVPAFCFAFLYNAKYAVGQIESIQRNTKLKLQLPALVTCLLLTVLCGLVLGGISLAATRSWLLLAGVLILFLTSEILSHKKYDTAREHAILQQAVEYSVSLGPCHLCGKAQAVTMRRYFFNNPNNWCNYTPVCEKHRHYIREVYSDGSEKWPQDGDCSQPGLLKMSIKK